MFSVWLVMIEENTC